MCGGVNPHSLTLWEWQALIWNWNERHATPDEEATTGELPDRDKALAAIAARKAKC